MNRRPAKTEALAQDDAASIAQSLRNDFIALIAVFDRQRVSGSEHLEEARANISIARAAAERGLRLSEQLVELLRGTDPTPIVDE
jgi:hypothetical protein